ncbi:2-oxo acid dehydrogenase subunit E2 [Planococcus sp. YIM B11945]|uniref:2-oxo acid dehydrogenase subunit E2 n=1 Tax=Planococcus sp. YIM B11945 TaxID=3435410 RepID=UPI003D7D1085
MAKEIFMPKLSSTMQVGTLLQWFKKEGDPVAVGDPLFEIMTDKINIEVEAYEEGILLKQYYQEDDEVPINHVVGYIGEPNEQVPATAPGEAGTGKIEKEVPPQLTESIQVEPSANPAPEKPRATPAARRAAREKEIPLAEVAGTGPKGRIQQYDVQAFITSKASSATPLAKKVAEAKGVDLQDVEGTGARGKIYREDVEKAQKRTAEPAIAGKRVKMEGIRKVVAERMLRSKTTAPHVTLISDIDMLAVVDMRKQLLSPVEDQTGYRISYTEIIVKAAAATLKRHLNMNVSLEGNEIVYHDEINIGLAVAAENGLFVPVIKNADQKGLASITAACKEAGKAARANKLKPDQMAGGTFTVSNLGMYAIDAFTPVINQPESAILGIGRIIEKPVGVGGSIELRPMMAVSLSFDHRVIDGAPAAAFLTDFKKVLEHPFELLM